ncbi:MAG: Omp28-related outer membrane protein [Ignavibacteria bacterium]|nr:Omp28-related outer membrane protein [Ignavibacteria bacterium]
MRILFFFVLAALQIFIHNSCSDNPPVENSNDPPSSPRNLSAIIDSSKGVIKEITFIWEIPSNPNGSNISQYIIYKNNNPNNLEIIGFTDGSVLSYVDTNVVSLQAFYYGVTARNEFGEGPFSNIVYVNNSLTFSEPSVPKDFSCIVVDDRIVLNWSPPLNNGGSAITAYRVYKGTSLLNMQYYITLDSSTLSYPDLLVVTNNTYFYKVTAQNFLYEGNPSETDSVTFTVSNMPLQTSPPNNAVISTLTPTMEWSNVSNFISYHLQISAEQGYNQLVTNVEGLTMSEYDVPSGVLNDRTTYYWRVKANTATGSSQWSSSFALSTLVEPINPSNKALVELFTNTSSVPCVDPNRYLDQINDNQGITSNDNAVVVLRVHTTMFAGDPFYLYNTADNDARMAFYPGTNVSNPRGYILGTYMSAYSASAWTNKINEQLANTRPFAIKLNNSYDLGTRNGNISIQIKQASGGAYSDLVYHCVMTENEIQFSAPNGETVFENTMRDLITPSNGQTITIVAGQTKSYSNSYSVPSNVEQNHADIIIFVQRTSTKEVLAVEEVKLK